MSVEFSRPKRPRLAVDMAPLIDVVFLLLVFFMLTSSFIPPSLPLDLPGTANLSPSPAEPIVVSMDSRGTIAINGEVTSREAFETSLGALLEQLEKDTVLFRGDKEAGYGEFLQLMDAARRAGAVRLHLLHQPE